MLSLRKCTLFSNIVLIQLSDTSEGIASAPEAPMTFRSDKNAGESSYKSCFLYIWCKTTNIISMVSFL